MAIHKLGHIIKMKYSQDWKQLKKQKYPLQKLLKLSGNKKFVAEVKNQVKPIT